MVQNEAGRLGRRIASGLGEVTLHKVREAGFRNAEANAARIAAGESILKLRETPLAKGTTALVMAAGPSLHKQNVGERLRAANFQGTLITTESAMAYCFRYGLVPDLIVTVDPHPERIVRWFGDPALTPSRIEADDYYARQDMDPRFSEDQLRFNQQLLAEVNANGPGMRAAVASSASPAVVDRILDSRMQPYWWNPYYDDYDMPESLTRKIHGMNGLPCLNAGGNVGSAAWVIAHAVLGKSRIGIVGMDLGYYADTPYERTQYYYELVDLVGRERLDEVFVRVHNPHLGQDFYTDPAYLWYRDTFLEMAREADCRTYNCTEGGILFGDGVEFTTLDAFLEGTQDAEGKAR